MTNSSGPSTTLHPWEGTYAPLLRGTPEAWDEAYVDQRAQAQSFAAQGARDRDPYLLRQAGLSYRSVKEDYQAEICFAQATEMEGNWKGAGDRYNEIHLHDNAFRCYWKGQLWGALKQLAMRPDYVGRIESRAADFMTTGEVPPLSFLEALCSAVNDQSRLNEISRDTTWQNVLVATADRIARTAADSVASTIDLLTVFDRLEQSGVRIDASSLATIAYRTENFGKAIELWERGDQIQHREYKRAKALVTPFPECIEHYRQLGDSAEMLRRLDNERPSARAIRSLKPQIAYAIMDAALDQGDLGLVATLSKTHPDRDRLGRLLAAAVHGTHHNIVCDAAVVASRLFVQGRHWEEAVDAESLVSLGNLAGTTDTEIRESLTRLGKSRVILGTVIWELATSDALVDEAPPVVASFLQRRFIARNDAHGSGKRDHDIPENVIGAAIERSGRIVDALQYYENLLEEAGTTQATKRFAAERLVRNLERHTRYFERRGNPLAQQQKTRAERLRREWWIGQTELDDYPQIGKPKEMRSEADDVARTASPRSFWDSPNLEALARSQNVEPVSDVEDLFGTWPGDESDGFEAAIDALRHSDSGHDDS